MNAHIEQRPSLGGRLFVVLKKLVFPFFRSEEKRRAWSLLGLLAFMLVSVSAVNVAISYIGRDFMTALSDRNADAFYLILPKYIAGLVLATIIAVAYRYTEERFALTWRNWMTKHLVKRYFFGRAYYNLRLYPRVDNPDQRIAEDVKNVTATSLSLLLICIHSIITVCAFVGVLSSISLPLVGVLVVYAVSGTAGTVLIGKRLVRLYNRQYQREANFRYNLIRVRENAESIAFYRGEARERVQLGRKFAAIFENTLSIIDWNRNLGLFTTGYNNLSIIIPTVIVAPLYLKGLVEFGVITQAASAFAQVLAALSVLITQFERISAFAAGVYRLEALWDLLNARVLNDEEDDPEISIEEGKSLSLQHLTVIPPKSDRVLVQDLNYDLRPRSSVLIMGPSGSGKSSILRTVAGLWSTGHGSIRRPRLRDMMFLPQKPYLPTGSLRAQLVYPKREQNEGDEKLYSLLKDVNLEEILHRVGGDLSRTLDWPNILSLGEQQRLAFARLLYRAPRIAFLDEATSALDEENEARMYELLRMKQFTYMSVGHRSTLAKFHDAVMNLDTEGRWSVSGPAR